MACASGRQVRQASQQPPLPFPGHCSLHSSCCATHRGTIAPWHDTSGFIPAAMNP